MYTCLGALPIRVVSACEMPECGDQERLVTLPVFGDAPEVENV